MMSILREKSHQGMVPCPRLVTCPRSFEWKISGKRLKTEHNLPFVLAISTLSINLWIATQCVVGVWKPHHPELVFWVFDFRVYGTLRESGVRTNLSELHGGDISSLWKCATFEWDFANKYSIPFYCILGRAYRDDVRAVRCESVFSKAWRWARGNGEQEMHGAHGVHPNRILHWYQGACEVRRVESWMHKLAKEKTIWAAWREALARNELDGGAAAAKVGNRKKEIWWELGFPRIRG